MLESGREPTPADWDSLFTVPGYVTLTELEFPRDVFAERMRLACLPSRAAERGDALGANKSAQLAHFVEVRRRWAELEAAAVRLAASNLHPQAVELACRWLPACSRERSGATAYPDPPVSFLIFMNDARGSEPVVVDVLMAAELPERDLTLILAHEFHHFYRNRLLAFDQSASPAGCGDLLWVIDQIHAEGLADLINVPEMIYGGGAWASGAASLAYRAAVEAAPAYLARLDQALSEVDSRLAASPSGSADLTELAALSRSLREALPRSGHPIGYYMASFLARSGHAAELVDTLGDPFAFFRVYQDAAAASGPPAFGPRALSALAALRGLCAWRPV